MGGVGKTTALKGIYTRKAVCDTFVDCVYYLEFGKKASARKVMDELIRCVRNSGGIKLGSKLGKVDNLSEVVSRASEWLKDRTVLLVCDDLSEFLRNVVNREQ